MFGIGSTELLVILVVALIVLGPKSLATVSRSLGKAMGEFRRVSTDFQRTLNVEAVEAEEKERAEARRRAARAEENSKGENSASQTAENGSTAPGFVDPRKPAASQESPLAGIPPDSPIAEAIAKARAEAEAAYAKTSKPDHAGTRGGDANA